MRVIRDGVEIQAKCPHCGSVLGIAPEDVEDCAVSGKTWAVCPVCGLYVDLKASDMPEIFKRRVKWDE